MTTPCYGGGSQAGSSEVTGLVGVETAASGAQSHHCRLSAYPTTGSGDGGSCFLPRRGKNVHILWGQLSTHLRRAGRAPAECPALSCSFLSVYGHDPGAPQEECSGDQLKPWRPCMGLDHEL